MCKTRDPWEIWKCWFGVCNNMFPVIRLQDESCSCCLDCIVLVLNVVIFVLYLIIGVIVGLAYALFRVICLCVCKRCGKDQLEVDITLPATWKIMDNGTQFERVPLAPDSQEYNDVLQNVLATAYDTVNQVLQIERVQNEVVYKQYVTFKSTMDKPKDFQYERTLWHGTAKVNVNNICSKGFDRYYTKAAYYGDGTYFARNLSYSAGGGYCVPDEYGIKYIMQCKVLTGEYARGFQGMKEPPFKENDNRSKRYDSLVNDVDNPTVFVIFNLAQVYPEYVVAFN